MKTKHKLVYLIGLDEFYKPAYSILQNQGTVEFIKGQEWSSLGSTYTRHLMSSVGPLGRSLENSAVDSFDSVFDVEHEFGIESLF